MTDDLERLWDDLPVGRAPVSDILRAARRRTQSEQQGRRLRRSLRTATVLGGVAAAFVAGTLVTQQDAGTGGASGSAEPGAPTPAAFHGALKAAPSCEALLRSYVDRAVDVVGAYGWGGPPVYYRGVYNGPLDDLAGAYLLAGVARTSNDRGTVAPQTKGSYASATGTNVQEAGVDEPDVVKTDGSLLVRLQGSTLTTYDVSGAQVERQGSVDLDDFHDGEILLAGDTVVAIGDDGTRPTDDTPPVGYYQPYAYGEDRTVRQTRVVTVDVGDPTAPEVTDTVDYDAATLSARQHGDDVRLVLSSGLPDLDFVRPHRGLRTVAARKHNEQLVRETTLDDWLPHISANGDDDRQLLDCDHVAVPQADTALGTMAVVGFGADEATDKQAIGLATDTALTYESPDHLYLAADDTGDEAGTTHVYDFTVDGAGASYVGSGDVEGRLADRWSLDEQDGVLRLAVEPTQQTGNFNSILTLRAEGDRLVEVGRLDRIGVGEQLKSVRWFPDLAIVVTFRQVDPLYAVDLSHQDRPRLLGHLKVPGFSSYLHPLGPRRLIGVGEGRAPDGGYGAQAAFLDATDVTHPTQLGVVHFPGMEAGAPADPRQFTWLPDHRVALTVLSRYRSRRVGYVATLLLGHGRIHSRLTRVEYGDDVDDVRLVPLPQERVALVTGDNVRFFDYGR